MGVTTVLEGLGSLATGGGRVRICCKLHSLFHDYCYRPVVALGWISLSITNAGVRDEVGRQ